MIKNLMDNTTINLKATGMDLTDAIRDYVENRVTNLSKLLSKVESDVLIEFEVAKTTNHHNNSEHLYRAECRVTFSGEDFYTQEESSDLYASIDAVKDKIFRDVRDSRDRSRNLFIRNARKIKKRIKGFKPW
ncbi:MAG: ribosomal subunit interface protein [Candidatus Paceibacteria bacterium]|jgi:ribosomal subunit interface protein